MIEENSNYREELIQKDVETIRVFSFLCKDLVHSFHYKSIKEKEDEKYILYSRDFILKQEIINEAIEIMDLYGWNYHNKKAKIMTTHPFGQCDYHLYYTQNKESLENFLGCFLNEQEIEILFEDHYAKNTSKRHKPVRLDYDEQIEGKTSTELFELKQKIHKLFWRLSEEDDPEIDFFTTQLVLGNKNQDTEIELEVPKRKRDPLNNGHSYFKIQIFSMLYPEDIGKYPQDYGMISLSCNFKLYKNGLAMN